MIGAATHPSSEFSMQLRNVVLAQLPEREFGALERHLVPVALPLGMKLSQPNAPVEFIYFPNSGLISTDAMGQGGEQVEVGVAGREGFSGFPGLLDQPQMAHTVVMQSGGDGLRIRASILRNEFHKGGVLRQLVHAFLYLQFVQITQSVLCNRIHEVEGRLGRWLLTSADRTESEVVNLTQEFLSQMLGVQRSTVTVAAGELQRRGLIEYTRGRIHLLDRPKLIQASCECYTIVNASYQRLLQPDERGNLRYILPEDANKEPVDIRNSRHIT